MAAAAAAARTVAAYAGTETRVAIPTGRLSTKVLCSSVARAHDTVLVDMAAPSAILRLSRRTSLHCAAMNWGLPEYVVCEWLRKWTTRCLGSGVWANAAVGTDVSDVQQQQQQQQHSPPGKRSLVVIVNVDECADMAVLREHRFRLLVSSDYVPRARTGAAAAYAASIIVDDRDMCPDTVFSFLRQLSAREDVSQARDQARLRPVLDFPGFV